MDTQYDNLEKLFNEFIKFIKSTSGEDFESFHTSKFLVKNENYKYKVYEEARESLGNKFWRPEDIGTGKIQLNVISAIKTKVYHNFQMVDNNLVDWRKKDDFSKLPKNRFLEDTFFNFYKSKIKDEVAFDNLLKQGLSYQFIAYLFFIKDRQRFMPISQERFDDIFELLGLNDFKTVGNASWDNYIEYCNIIKQVQTFLKTKDKNTTLLDAHSFLWIVGWKLSEEHSIPTKIKPKEIKKDEGISDSGELTEAQDLTHRNPKWHRDEIILALDLFFRLDSGQMHARNQQVIELSEILNKLPIHTERPDKAKFRNPNGVGLKLSNFLAIDPSYSGKGMESYSKLDEAIFNEFVDDKSKLKQIADQIKKTVTNIEITNSLNNITDDDIDEDERVKEGRVLYKLHKYRERNTIITKKKKQNHFKKYGCIKCEVCGFDFKEKYGEIGDGFIECHHRIPLSEFKSVSETKLEDLALVCANCHRILHKYISAISIEELKMSIERKQYNR
jgi:5-methylcytosine-specific restriction enzyme A